MYSFHTIGEKIKALRQKEELTLEEVGGAVGVGKSTVKKWESGAITKIGSDKLEALANILHTSVSYLLGVENIDYYGDSYRALEIMLSYSFGVEKTEQSEKKQGYRLFKKGSDSGYFVEFTLYEQMHQDTVDFLENYLDNVFTKNNHCEKEKKLIENFRELTEEGQEFILQNVELAADSTRYKKHNDDEASCKKRA